MPTYKKTHIPAEMDSKLQFKVTKPAMDSYQFNLDAAGNSSLTILIEQITKKRHLIVQTTDATKLTNLPSSAAFSMVVQVEKMLHHYLADIEVSYAVASAQEKSWLQQKKKLIENILIEVDTLRSHERALLMNDVAGLNLLKHRLIAILNHGRIQNRILTNNVVSGEGMLNEILYSAIVAVKEYDHYQDSPEDRSDSISLADQLDFTTAATREDCIENETLRRLIQNNLGIGMYQLTAKSIRRINDYCENLPNKFDFDVLDRLLSFNGGLRVKTIEGRAFSHATRHKLLLAIKKHYKMIQISQQRIKESRQADSSVNHAPKKNYVWHSDIHIPAGSQRQFDDVINVLVKNFDLSQQNNHYTPEQIQRTTRNRLVKLYRFIKLATQKIRSTMDRLANGVPDHDESENIELASLVASLPSPDELHKTLNQEQRKLYFWDRAKIRWQNFSTNSTPAKVINAISFIEKLIQPYLAANNKLPHKTYKSSAYKKIHTLQQSTVLITSEHQFIENGFHDPIHFAFGIIKSSLSEVHHFGEKNPITASLALGSLAFGTTALIAPTALKAILAQLHAKALIPGIDISNRLVAANVGSQEYQLAFAGLAYVSAVTGIAEADILLQKGLESLADSPVDFLFLVAVGYAVNYAFGMKLKPDTSIPTLLGILVGAYEVNENLHSPKPTEDTNLLLWLIEYIFLIPNTIIATLYYAIKNSNNNGNWLLDFGKSRNIFVRLPCYILGLVFPGMLTTNSWQKFKSKNSWYAFGATLLEQQGYLFLPKFINFIPHPNHAWYSPRVIWDLLSYGIVNSFISLAYPITAIIKFIMLLVSPFVPALLATPEFSNSMKNLLHKSFEGAGTLLHAIAWLSEMLIEHVPGLIHIIYTSTCKLIAKSLGTIAEPGKIADVMFQFSLRKWQSFADLKFSWRISRNYGFTPIKQIKYALFDPSNYGWFKALLIVFIVDPIIIAAIFIKEILRNPVLLLVDFILSPATRLLIHTVDVLSRSVTLILGAICKGLDIVINAPHYCNSKLPFPGNLVQAIAVGFINITARLDNWAGQPKNWLLDCCARLKRTIKEVFFAKENMSNDVAHEIQNLNRAEQDSMMKMLSALGRKTPRVTNIATLNESSDLSTGKKGTISRSVSESTMVSQPEEQLGLPSLN